MEAKSHPRHLAPREQNVSKSIGLDKLLELLRKEKIFRNASTCCSCSEKGVSYKTDAPFT